MADREKVIRGLKCCIWKEQQGKCEECPYYLTLCIKKDAYQLKEDAIALLKLREPKPPVIKENSYGWKFYYCPSCGKEFYQNNKFSFCEKCGQAVKWDG